jgi:hypothetical protein
MTSSRSGRVRATALQEPALDAPKYLLRPLLAKAPLPGRVETKAWAHLRQQGLAKKSADNSEYGRGSSNCGVPHESPILESAAAPLAAPPCAGPKPWLQLAATSWASAGSAPSCASVKAWLYTAANCGAARRAASCASLSAFTSSATVPYCASTSKCCLRAQATAAFRAGSVGVFRKRVV